MSFFKVLSLVASLSLLAGCATQKHSEEPKVVAPPEKKADDTKPMPSVVTGNGWSIDLKDNSLWEKRTLAVANNLNVKIEGNWVTTKRLGSSYATLTIVSMGTDVGQSELEFIQDYFIEQDKSDDVKFLDVRKVKIESGDLAGFAVLAHRFPHGIMGTIELVAARAHRGFVVTCSGPVEDAAEWTDICEDSLSTFAIK